MTADPPASRARWLPFALVAAAWMAVAAQQITLPGVYMDAVDPDYLAVRLLNPDAEPITAWLIGGNYLFGQAPVLISFYHGSQQVWLGLPGFALFGTTVTGLRLTHALFALGLLAALHAMLVRGGVAPWLAALAGVALAVDPGFSYAFRTQSYITLAPMAWLFLALVSLQGAARTRDRQISWLVGSGICYGLAVVGYFIYAFFAPAMLLAVALWRKERSAALSARPDSRGTRRWLPSWLAGLALGGSFYPVGYGLFVAAAGGVSTAWALFRETQQALGAFSAQSSLPDRIAHIRHMADAVFGNGFHHQLIFGEQATLPWTGAKMVLLLAIPAVAWLRAELRGGASVMLRVGIALPLCYVVAAAFFGTRLQGHHFVLLLPLAYAALAVALGAARADASPSRSALAVSALAFAALAALGAWGQAIEARRLAETKGVGLYSDAINRLADDLNARNRKPFVVFPDWGLSMPIAFLTRGTIGMDSVVDVPALRRTLCDGRDVAFAVVTGERAARIAAWQADLGWDAPAVTPYAQADGKVVFALATFGGRRDAPACAQR
jgi:hypothetical protein